MKPRNRIVVTQSQRLQLSQAMTMSLQMLRLDAAALAQHLEDQAEQIPELVFVPAAAPAGIWLPRWNGVFPGDGGSVVEALPDHRPSLMAHVLTALPLLVADGAGQRIAIALTEVLEPTGWLGASLSHIAGELGVAVSVVEAVLLQMQQIEPTGLFARDLAECLRLQALDAECLDAGMAVILRRLDLLAAADWPELARLCNLTEAEIIRRFRIIRGFNPKPGLLFSALASPLREPDLTARKTVEGWEVALNSGALPSLRLVDGADGSSSSPAREAIRQLQARNTTLLAVAQAMLLLQERALEQGPAALRPMLMQQIADTVGVHKSTVSRVVEGAAVDTPYGSWWLRSLFSADMGGGYSAAALRARLSQLVATEDPAAPYSDDDLTAALSASGAEVARRTVAKYRAALRIPPAWRRKASA